MELLAPAGSPEAVTAAVQNGADAVYLSFDVLSDCRQTENFSDSAFETAVRYCRIRGCKVYLALNAPVREEEMQKVQPVYKQDADISADSLAKLDEAFTALENARVTAKQIFLAIRNSRNKI